VPPPPVCGGHEAPGFYPHRLKVAAALEENHIQVTIDVSFIQSAVTKHGGKSSDSDMSVY